MDPQILHVTIYRILWVLWAAWVASGDRVLFYGDFTIISPNIISIIPLTFETTYNITPLAIYGFDTNTLFVYMKL